jgi:hypothetical protein
VQLSQAGSVVSLAEIETPYKIVGVDSVFNETLDPDARHDIAGVYDGGAQTVGLTEAGSAGDLIRVRFVYAPPIVFTTSQNYVEMAAVPAITVTGSAGTRKTHTRGASVIDRATGKGWQLSPAVQIDFDLSIKFVTDKLRDHMRLAGAVRQFVDDNPLIRLSGLDEDTPLRIISDYDQDAGAQSGLHSGRIRVRLDRAVIVSGDATEVVSVRRMDLALSGDE